MSESFEKLTQEFITQYKAITGEEVMEGGSIIKDKEPPYPSAIILDEKTLRDYAGGVGDDNPLFTDPAYAAKTRYGCLIASPPILIGVRYTTSHGPGEREETGQQSEWPMANIYAGNMFQWYDVIPLGTRFRTSLRHREFLEKKGSKGRLLIAVSDGFYWNQRGEILARCRGHEIFIPMESRTGHDTERIGEQMLYERPIQSYTQEEIEKIKSDIEKESRRGAEILYWEDVNVGDTIPTLVMGPYTSQDDIGFIATRCRFTRTGHDYTTFALKHKEMREWGATYKHPVSGWPWTTHAEHEDPYVCRYRGLPGPFDYGAQRVCFGGRMLTDWMGDDGFLRKQYLDLRKFKYYGDTTWFSGTIIEKYKVTEKGEAGVGGVPGEADYCAVDIQITAINQIGEKTVNSKATVYLPSRELGPIKLPIPHCDIPPGVYREATSDYIPFPRYHKDDEAVSLAGKFPEKKVVF